VGCDERLLLLKNDDNGFRSFFSFLSDEEEVKK